MTLPTYTGGRFNPWRFKGFREGAIICGCDEIAQHHSNCKKFYVSDIYGAIELKSFWDILKEKTIPYYEKYFSDQILKVLVGVNTVADLNKILAKGAVTSLNVRNTIKNGLISGTAFIEELDELKIESFWDYVRKKAETLPYDIDVAGTVVFNTVDNKLYIRSNGAWKKAG